MTTDCVEELLSRLRCSPVYSNDVTSPDVYATLRDPSHVYATVRNVNWSTGFPVCQQFFLKTSIIKWKLYKNTFIFVKAPFTPNPFSKRPSPFLENRKTVWNRVRTCKGSLSNRYNRDGANESKLRSQMTQFILDYVCVVMRGVWFIWTFTKRLGFCINE